MENTLEKIREDIRAVQKLIRQAEEEGTADALAAKSLFLQLIAKLEQRLAQVEASWDALSGPGFRSKNSEEQISKCATQNDRHERKRQIKDPVEDLSDSLPLDICHCR